MHILKIGRFRKSLSLNVEPENYVLLNSRILADRMHTIPGKRPIFSGKSDKHKGSDLKMLTWRVLQVKAHPDRPTLKLTVDKSHMCLPPLFSFDVPHSEI